MNIEDKIKYIADYYGHDRQALQLIEEMAELTQAICKLVKLDISLYVLILHQE